MRRTSNNSTTTNSPSRFQAASKVSSLNRRSLHHQSNGSLHSADSQSSTSPAPSPLPRPASVHSTNNTINGNLISNNVTASNASTNSPTGLAKRWGSTGDFVMTTMTSPTNISSSALMQNRYTAKSLLNLQSKNSPNNSFKHG